MPDNYASAAARHLDDARLLLMQKRFDNAAYLAGYVAECTVKVLLITPAPAPIALGHDLAVLTTDALQMLWLFVPAMKRYTIPQTADVITLIQQWNPEMRYAVRGGLGESITKQYVAGAEQLFESLPAQLILDGWSTFS